MQLVGKCGAVAREVLKHGPEDQAGDWIEIAGEGIAAEPQRLQRDRATTRERIDDERRLFRMCRLYQTASSIEKCSAGGVVPIGEVANEPEQCLAQLLIAMSKPSRHRLQELARFDLEIFRAMGIARVGQEQRQEHCPAGRERSACPPQVQCRGVAVAYRFLSGGVLRDNGNRKVDLGEALALARDQRPGL
jgi:hypothetical protein